MGLDHLICEALQDVLNTLLDSPDVAVDACGGSLNIVSLPKLDREFLFFSQRYPAILTRLLDVASDRHNIGLSPEERIEQRLRLWADFRHGLGDNIADMALFYAAQKIPAPPSFFEEYSCWVPKIRAFLLLCRGDSEQYCSRCDVLTEFRSLADRIDGVLSDDDVVRLNSVVSNLRTLLRPTNEAK